jgi:hypothetical protein
MSPPAANPPRPVRHWSGLRTILPAAALGLWLSAFWFLSGERSHRSLLAWLVIPSLFLVSRELFTVARSSRWLWLAAALLGWQTLSRLWSGDFNAPQGWSLDLLLVFGLLCALLATARAPVMWRVVFPALAFVSAVVAAATIVMFYLSDGRNLCDHRLRNMFFYKNGLNAVCTGFLFAFGALIAAWQTSQPAIRGARAAQITACVLSLLGLLATQSRGPMLMFALGLLCLLAFERKRALPALVAVSATSLVYFGALLWVGAGREAMLDLVERGSTGRFAIYQWFLSHMSLRDVFIGTGMARPPTLPQETLGWRVFHPHSIYLTQFYQTGIIGVGLLLALIARAGQSALALARRGESLWFCLLFGGCVALIFDGGQVFTVYSVARIEILLVAVPAAMAIGRDWGSGRAEAG